MVTIDVWQTTALETLHPMLLQWMYNVSVVSWLINRNQTVALLPTYTERDNKSDYQCCFKGITRLSSIVLTVAAVNP